MNRGRVVVRPLAIGIVMPGISTISPSRADHKCISSRSIMTFFVETTG